MRSRAYISRTVVRGRPRLSILRPTATKMTDEVYQRSLALIVNGSYGKVAEEVLDCWRRPSNAAGR